MVMLLTVQHQPGPNHNGLLEDTVVPFLILLRLRVYVLYHLPDRSPIRSTVKIHFLPTPLPGEV